MGLAAGLVLALTAPAHAQRRPHIGYVYPAGGQAGTTVRLRLGGQELTDPVAVVVTGGGVTARVVDYYRRLGNQEVQLLKQQVQELEKTSTAAAPKTPPAMAAADPAMMAGMTDHQESAGGGTGGSASRALIEKIEQRIREWVATPACASIANLVLVEVVIAPDAPPGPRELRVVTAHGISNPLVFHVGQFREYARKPMITATLQVLGKEAAALRKRPADEAEAAVELPCTVNGQIASGEVNRYRFNAVKGQRLVFSVQARQLIPYIADAVPGWFQPILVVADAKGRELAFADDYWFKPDPVIFFEVPEDGEYTVAIRDSIYRGREDFVYRITAGELPFITSIFPLGWPVGTTRPPNTAGWGIADAELVVPPADACPDPRFLAARKGGLLSNRVPFALDTLPEVLDQESNNTTAAAQPLTLPVIVNGRIDRPDDWDVFQFAGKAGDPVVIEVQARHLDSPLDSVVKLTDAAGNLLAFNDDREDLTSGTNTHHADSYLMTRLPTDGSYFVHLGDTARHGGGDYGYRLRLSAPQPDFELRVVPSSVSIPIKGAAAVSVYVVRKDGFKGPIRLELEQEAPEGFSAAPVTLWDSQAVTRLTLKGGATPTSDPVRLSIVGRAKVGERELVHRAVAAEDRMQAFLWRHLVPAAELLGMIHDPRYQPPPKRLAPQRPPPVVAADVPPTAPPATGAPPKFTKQQIAGRLKQLKLLYEEGLLTDAFYDVKVSECELSQ